MIINKINIPCITLENKSKHYIYYIKNIITNKYYIGACLHKKGIANRFQRHIWFLKSNRHHSKKLQNSFNKYSSDFSVWEFGLLEPTTLSIQKEREQYYINLYDSYHNGYNATAFSDKIFCGKMPLEQKLLIKKSKETLTEEVIINIFNLFNTGSSHREISKIYNISTTTIIRILNDDNHYSEYKLKNSLSKSFFNYFNKFIN